MNDSPSSPPKLKGLARYRSFIKGTIVLVGSSIIPILILELLVWLGFRDEVQRINVESQTALASSRLIDWWNCAGHFDVCAAGFIWNNSSPVAIAIRAFELLCSSVFLVWLVFIIPIENRFRNYIFSAYAIWIGFVIVLFSADYIGRVFHVDSIEALGGLGLAQAAGFGVALVSFVVWLSYQSRTVLYSRIGRLITGGLEQPRSFVER